ncbi:MAG: alpha/beta hydrolase [Clostridiales Family XIII bacterium]|jgi:acetyl esterase/lipase|nr:alpha/beta hydrolase [Clostridiales Family XIII bacterium]
MSKEILLWEDGAPLFDPAIGQAPPALKPFLTGEKGRGAVIVCAGGGYAIHAEREADPAAVWINRCGVNAFVLSYRLLPYRHPVMLLDAQRAVRLVRHRAAEWGIDPGHIGILGFSAGGHLAALAATRADEGDPKAADATERVSSRPDLFASCYGVNSLAHISEDFIRKLSGGSDRTKETLRDMDPIANVSAKTPPAFLWHTAADDRVPVQSSIDFAAALTEHGVPYSLHIFPHGGHALGLAEGIPLTEGWPKLLNRFLLDFGF